MPIRGRLPWGQLQRIVGRNLRRHRVEQGYSREAFADRMGVHRTYFSSVERGERNLTLQTLEKIPPDLLLARRTRGGSVQLTVPFDLIVRATLAGM